jgi:hypothetical protein
MWSHHPAGYCLHGRLLILLTNHDRDLIVPAGDGLESTLTCMCVQAQYDSPAAALSFPLTYHSSIL